jgi:hypothetical protein
MSIEIKNRSEKIMIDVNMEFIGTIPDVINANDIIYFDIKVPGLPKELQNEMKFRAHRYYWKLDAWLVDWDSLRQTRGRKHRTDYYVLHLIPMQQGESMQYFMLRLLQSDEVLTYFYEIYNLLKNDKTYSHLDRIDGISIKLPENIGSMTNRCDVMYLKKKYSYYYKNRRKNVAS